MFSILKEIPVTKLDAILEALSTPGILDLDTHDLLVYGGGGLSTSYYHNLRTDPEIEILWTGWCGPKWTSFFSFIPGQAGLLRILKQTRLKPLYEELAAHSVSYLCYLPKSATEIIKQAVMRGPSSHDPKKILQNEFNFFFLECEMDETINRHGEECFIFDIVVGAKLPTKISALFSDG